MLGWAPNLDFAGSGAEAPAVTARTQGDVRAWSRRWRHTMIFVGICYAIFSRHA